jgi:LysR family transcriptional regulator of beta-lactamase
MFGRDLNLGYLVRPFDIEITTGRYWLPPLKSREDSPATVHFRGWPRRAAG